MKHVLTSVTMILGLVVLGAAPAAGQLWFFPDYAVPSSGDTPATWIAGSYGRGLNEVSGELDAFSVALGRTTGRVSFAGGLGFINDAADERDDEYTLGGALGVDLIESSDSPVQLTLQGGVGWMDIDFFGETITLWRFPIGLALKGRGGGDSSTSVTPWIMPRLNITRATSDDESDTETDFGVSGGLAVTTGSGFGIHAALDYLAIEDEQPWILGVGVHFVLGSGT